MSFISLGFIAGLVLTGRMRSWTRLRRSRPPPAPGAQPRSAAATAGGLHDLTGIAQRAVDGVTNISSTQTVRRQTSPFASDPFFQFFFGDDPFSYRDRREQSLGSGVLVSRDGYVLTNNHVVSGGNDRAVINEVSVVLTDKRELKAKLVGTDVMTDIAVLKINATDLPALTWGDSSKLKVAEWVLAVGQSLSLNQTVTLAFGRATGRRLAAASPRTRTSFRRMRRSIRKLRGALITARGELIGINTPLQPVGGYQGIGFAVRATRPARHDDSSSTVRCAVEERGHSASADDDTNRR